ncbi:hypothetical protein [Pseudonocardia sp.]|uniref:hypothetical protein n=1 Tax=Pseudonocardia sp. TaxID=60912 RepID=UPI00262836AC|nr:hypothetical protein [Pseudonocardia sp.]
MRPRRSPPVVVTDMREPLIVVHRRMMRVRLVLMVIWLAGWVVAGVLYRHGWLATAILLGSGPGVWMVWFAVRSRCRTGRREAVSRPVRGELGAGGDR